MPTLSANSIILSVILQLIFTFTNLLLIFYPFFRVFIKLTAFHLVAQIYKIAKKRLENKEIAVQNK